MHLNLTYAGICLRNTEYWISIALVTAGLSVWPGPIGTLHTIQKAATSDPVIAAAGDIACDPADPNFHGGSGSADGCREKYTSNLLVDHGLAAVLDLGDNQYYCGGYQAFLQSYDPTWGRVKSITHPAVGNHEYLISGGTDCNIENEGAAGYFQYFGAAAGSPGKGYYSFDIGAWHLIALNSNCGDAGGCGSGSDQYEWLASDLQSHKNLCTLAYWHIPLYSSGGRASPSSQPLWELLYQNNADLVLNGHDHIYERFAPQNPNGAADVSRGIREFVVGTGGSNHTSIAQVAANSEVRNTDTFGVLRLTLHPSSYDWQFVHETGKPFSDSGTGTCHGPDTSAPSAPANLTASSVSWDQVALTWAASNDNVGVAGYKIFRNGTQIATSKTAFYTDKTVAATTSYSYYVAAFDAAQLTSSSSNTIRVTTPAAPPPTFTPTPTPSATPTMPIILFKDGFQNGNLSKWTWSSGLFVESIPANGSFFARGIGNPLYGEYARKRLDKPRNDLYYRILFRISRRGPDQLNLMQFRAATGRPILTVRVNADGKLAFRDGVSEAQVDSNVMVASGAWHSLQAHLQVAGAASRVEVWYDLAPVGALSGTRDLGTNLIGAIQLGDPRPGLTYDVSFDGVVVSKTYFGSNPMDILSAGVDPSSLELGGGAVEAPPTPMSPFGGADTGASSP